MLDVNDTSHTGGNPSLNPDSFKINNGATVYTTATAVNAGDTIHLMNAGTATATFVVPSELAIVQPAFSATPPSTINFTSGGWQSSNRTYEKHTSSATNNYVRYELYQSGSLVDVIYGISFYVNANNNLELDINESPHGSSDPWKYSINSGSTLTAAAEVSVGDTIQLRNNVGNIDAEIRVPTELAVLGSKLSSTTDAGEYIKLDLGVAVEATTLTLKSIASEIEEFKLYGSPDDAAWTEIHAQTSANITPSGTEFQITSPGSYQYYGLVITKNYGYHNVKLAEMKLSASGTVDLSNYYNKQEVNNLLPKGVLAEGSFTYVKNNSSSFAIAQANFFAASSNIGWNSSLVQVQSWHFGDPTIWAYAPACRQLIYQFTFTSPILDDANQETSDYKVMLTRRDISLSYHQTIYELAVYEKTPDYFKVRIELEVDTSTYNIETHGFDFVVF